MYHIKPDRRAQLSAKLICDGLFACLKEKSFDKITITDIQNKAIVGRSTFYRLFDTTEDVFAYMADQVYQEIFAYKMTHPEENIAQIMLTHWMAHDDLLGAMVQSNTTHILQAAEFRYKHALMELILIDREENDPTLDFDIVMLHTLMVSVLRYWVEHGKKETMPELYEKTGASLSAVVQLFK